MSALGRALIDELDDAALDRLAERLGPRIRDLLAERCDTGEDRWMNTREAAAFLGLSVDALHKLTAARAVPFEQDAAGGKCWFKRSDLDAWRRGRG